MSLAIVYSRARLGISAPLVTVEVHLSNGLPSLSIVGLPETAVKESKDRVRSAIINSQFEFPARRITINLAPADLPKEGGRFDLAIAIGILVASEQLPDTLLKEYEFVGELALTGEIREVNGVLPAAIACGESQRRLIAPRANQAELALSESTQSFCAEHLVAVATLLMNTRDDKAQDDSTVPGLSPVKFQTPKFDEKIPDLNEIRGQHHAKRALEIAAAGGHNILFFGPPGTGKTMLASRLPGILPNLTQSQALEVASVHSLCGHQRKNYRLAPFRSPHHTASSVALVGGGGHPKPGEISLAHRGVLFLDELPEFQRQVLEVLREPLEAGEIRISRARGQLTFPAQFQLVAAMNPCPCGYLSSKRNSSARHQGRRVCQCTPQQIQRYRQKISGPLLDRIDLHIAVNEMKPEEISAPLNEHANVSEHSKTVRERVIAARERQYARQSECNAQLSVKALDEHCQLENKERQLLCRAIETLNLSARAYHRIVKVARTIADLDDQPCIRAPHIAEALSLRHFDR